MPTLATALGDSISRFWILSEPRQFLASYLEAIFDASTLQTGRIEKRLGIEDFTVVPMVAPTVAPMKKQALHAAHPEVAEFFPLL